MKHLTLALLLLSTSAFSMEQKNIPRVDQMADIPRPFQIIDYKKMAVDFDRKVFDFTPQDSFWPLVWIDHARHNTDEPVVGVFTTIGDSRQGAMVQGGTFHESLGMMGAVLGASLVGIDKTNQGDFNYVRMLKTYFNVETGWNIMQNNTNPQAGSLGGGYARDWWYDVFPNLLFYAIYDLHPNEKDFESMAKTIADKFYEADKMLAGNYNHSYFDYKTMEPKTSWICAQPDVAAGHSWVLYSAYKKFKNPKYLSGAVSALQALESNTINPSYEVLMPFGALMAARLNAEKGFNFDIQKMLDWTFDGTAVCRKGWGTLVGNWNGFDISGLVGSTVDHGGYGFLMNTYDQAWPLVSMVRYDQRYASAIGKYMLNAANAARFTYPQYVSAEHQTLAHLADVTKGVIAYEGLSHTTTHPQYEATTIAPVAQGDGPKWVAENPDVTQFSVYGSAHVGIFGSIIRPTNVEGILQLDLLATDFFRDPAHPTFLYYNPFDQPKQLKIPLSRGKVFDVYDMVTGKFVVQGMSNSFLITIPAKSSAVLVLAPAHTPRTVLGKKLLIDNVVVDYHYQQTNK
jgi:hypothetical protein